MEEPPQSLQSLFELAKVQKKSLESNSGPSNPQYQEQLNAAISTFEECRSRISQFSIFSRNESVDDIATPDLQYLTLHYLFGEVLQRLQGTNRLQILRQARGEYDRYLDRLDDYGLLSPGDKKLYERYIENPDSFSLAPMDDAGTRRQVKVSRFREEKELKQKLEYLSQNPTLLQNDEEVVRKLRLAEIALYTHQTFQALDLLSQEMNMLAAVEAAGATEYPEQSDNRRRDGADNSEYSERLDIGITPHGRGGRSGGPLLDKKGAPLQPFVLTDRRTEIQKGVFREGHNLPTMSIDEYLEEERKRGGIIEGGGEQSGAPPEVDEDDYDKADAETMKAREWDEFTEANPRGSGNTMNRG